ncbi:anaerobic glycerol-3-phosphate dehydrogenase subunit B [Natrinema pellirubrum DSM 15624]|uniref:Anaerobic glycerol-3-phosphate dehydrogenase subunit B n=1 Tax=Natrinema pellirubrum (strain DSM 15624 / CIP 106293 / JCM 10476 / NCIMB 786 / 157) TaxID=797303 RepID=L0JJB5_NATP1|nr:glycerol-3-phosphate dehydrogenase subunit GlpB [Natrinema pellirubrum]AGB30923.1 glycerol-3-phosphate dehydrogenase, anaerobic, B subunit [Natrinema pellirubrum DSM 15624]ELY80693.1 anaerobic glycerol-3-phosphate dehydrogenase subunit B [Natrinema pellirubrum DSM 15624]
MAIEDDVLVVGGGLAGVTAALAAAERDVRVRLVSHKESTLRHASGLIDVLGYTPTGEGPLADPFAALETLPEGHPYERVGTEAVRDALAFFDGIAGEAYAGAHTDSNALVPTHGGTVKPTARYPAATAAGLASDDRDALLVGFGTLPDFEAPLAAAHLEAAGVPFDARGVTVRFPGIERDDAKVTRYAHLLDRDEPVETAAGESTARAALAETVRPHLEGESRVGFPAILGDDSADAVRADLADRLGVDVFEIPMGPPSLPGLRLEDLLFDALEDAGVRVTTGVPVVDYETAADGTGSSDPARIDRVTVDRNGSEIPHTADQYILATGGLVGKGVQSDRERVEEPVFDCHVPHPADRYDWFVDDVFDDQPYARFGLPVDRDLRPLDSDDALEFANLRAAGAVLGGYDFAAEKSGSGVSLATGYVAGRRAAEGCR